MIEDADLPAYQRHFVETIRPYALDPVSQKFKICPSLSAGGVPLLPAS